MRKSTIGFCLALPVAAAAFACSSSDDSSGGNGGGGGTSSGGTAHGGSGGAAKGGNAGTSSGGTSAGGKGGSTSGGTSSGGAAGQGEAGAGQAGAAEGGEAGTGNTEVPPANAVYTLSNDTAANAVFGFTRAADGTLTPMPASFPTGGTGTGASLGSQGSLAFDQQNERIYAVNAKDNSFSVFSVNTDGSLSAAHKVSTTAIASGTLLGPKSITSFGNTVYVLFEGDTSTPSQIAGWTVSGSGDTLATTVIAGSVLPLSSATKGVDPAQIAFSPDGKWLVVTEKQTGLDATVTGSGKIDTFSVDAAGLASNPKYNATAALPGVATLQSTPYGFAFQGSNLVVSEAGSNGVGVYTYAGGTVLPTVAATQFLLTGPLATPVAPCWVAVTGSDAYVSNTKGPNVSGFSVAADGLLTGLNASVGAVVATTGTATAGPSDESISADGKFLYVLDAGVPALGIFAIGSTGALTTVGAGDYLPTAAKLPIGSTGLVSR